MAGSKKKLLQPVTALPPQAWTPVMDAFLQIRDRFKSSELGAHELDDAIKSKRQFLGARRLLPDAVEACFICAPEFLETEAQITWRPDHVGDDSLPQAGKGMAGAWITWLPGKERPGRWFFFVR